MQIAVFKPKAHTDEGDLVWDKLRQKAIMRDEVADHVDDGWFTDASEALLAGDVGAAKREVASLESQLDDVNRAAALDEREAALNAREEALNQREADAAPTADGKIDLRTKAGRELKAKLDAEAAGNESA